MTDNARIQRDVVTMRFEEDVFSAMLQDELHVNMGISSILGTRKNQQDTVFGNVEGNKVLAIVCDGMGGMNGGEYASQTATTLLAEDYFKEKPAGRDIPRFLQQEAYKLDDAVYALKDENGRPLNGGTTIVTVIIEGDKMFFLSVGDSKIYIIRDNEIKAINREHNYRLNLDQMLRDGDITEEEYKAQENQAEALISYLGMGNMSLMDVNITPFILKENDIVVLCSDGLYKRLSDSDIRGIILFEEPDMQRAARRLTDVVMQRTKKIQDNTSLVLLQYSKF